MHAVISVLKWVSTAYLEHDKEFKIKNGEAVFNFSNIFTCVGTYVVLMSMYKVLLLWVMCIKSVVPLLLTVIRNCFSFLHLSGQS